MPPITGHIVKKPLSMLPRTGRNTAKNSGRSVPPIALIIVKKRMPGIGFGGEDIGKQREEGKFAMLPSANTRPVNANRVILRLN